MFDPVFFQHCPHYRSIYPRVGFLYIQKNGYNRVILFTLFVLFHFFLHSGKILSYIRCGYPWATSTPVLVFTSFLNWFAPFSDPRSHDTPSFLSPLIEGRPICNYLDRPFDPFWIEELQPLPSRCYPIGQGQLPPFILFYLPLTHCFFHTSVSFRLLLHLFLQHRRSPVSFFFRISSTEISLFSISPAFSTAGFLTCPVSMIWRLP